MIRPLVALCFLFAGFDAVALRAADTKPAGGNSIEIVRIWTGFRDNASFVRLGEYRDDTAEPGGAVVLRSQPANREGFYFTLRLRATSSAKAVPDGTIVLQVVAPDAAQSRSYTFPYSVGGARSAQLLVGVTGEDWGYGKAMPLAWKIEVLGADGVALAQRESFLWEKPVGGAR